MQLPFWREITPFAPLREVPIGQPSWDPYQLRIIKTRMLPLVHKLYGRNKDIIFNTKLENNLMRLYLNVTSDGESFLNLSKHKTELESQLNKILSSNTKHILLFISYEFEEIPSDFIADRLKYCPIIEDYDPYVDDEDGIMGLYVDLTFRPFDEDILSNFVADFIREEYKNRKESTYRLYEIGNNLVRRHFIAQYLKMLRIKPIFNSNAVYIPDEIDTEQIEEVIALSSGFVHIYNSTDPNEINRWVSKLVDVDYVIYDSYDPHYNRVLSVLNSNIPLMLN